MALLETDLIKLRALEPEDLEILYRWENDCDLWSFGNTLAPYSKFALREYISESRQDIFQTRQLRLMVALKETGAPIGTIDLYDFDPMNLRAGVGILLDADYRQKGFGLQVLELIKTYAFDFLLLKQLYAYVPANNGPSIKLFSRAGYEQTGQLKNWVKTRENFNDVYFMQLINPRLNI